MPAAGGSSSGGFFGSMEGLTPEEQTAVYTRMISTGMESWYEALSD